MNDFPYAWRHQNVPKTFLWDAVRKLTFGKLLRNFLTRKYFLLRLCVTVSLWLDLFRIKCVGGWMKKLCGLLWTIIMMNRFFTAKRRSVWKAVFHSNGATIWRHRRLKIRALLTTFAGRHRAPSKINAHWCGKFDGWTIPWLRRNEDFFLGGPWPTLVRNLLFNESENSSPVPDSQSKLEHQRSAIDADIDVSSTLLRPSRKVGGSGADMIPATQSPSIWSVSR